MATASKCFVVMVSMLLALLAIANVAVAADVYVTGLVPNWDQPYDYPDAYDITGPGPARARLARGVPLRPQP